jgi:hypothetical protein
MFKAMDEVEVIANNLKEFRKNFAIRFFPKVNFSKLRGFSPVAN